uniref:Lysosomal Pro-X carboxypeptidase n=1 Tax=Clastoptera arizonana TaxID=38151 RepID=A0A1B6D068_9HEMI
MGNIYYIVLVCCFFMCGPILSDYTYKIKYFDVLIDHFTFTNNATYKMRYLVNDSYWDPDNNAPIFFYTGNEGDITLFAQNTGFVWEIASEFRALIVFAEHRYYGTSMPFGNNSFSDIKQLGYLTSLQALSDYVDLISYLKYKHKHCPVIAFGGSYGGMLAAWMRMKYPRAITGSIASSAPIWQFTGLTPCGAFNRVLTSAFKLSSKKCAKNIRKSWDVINQITNTDDGKKWLSDSWRLCSPIKNQENITSLKNYLIDVYGNLAMVNYPYPSNFLAPLPANPVSEVCKELNKNVDGKQLLITLFKAVSIYFNYTGTATCLNTDLSYTDQLGIKGWNFQSCTEMVMPMCADGKNDMFEPYDWKINEVSDQCYKQFKVRPIVNAAVKLYNGKHIESASNIIFSNGLLDPWSSGGVLKNVSDKTIAILLPDSAHHLDLRSSNDADPVSVKEARNYYRDVISQWIHDPGRNI